MLEAVAKLQLKQPEGAAMADPSGARGTLVKRREREIYIETFDRQRYEEEKQDRERKEAAERQERERKMR